MIEKTKLSDIPAKQLEGVTDSFVRDRPTNDPEAYLRSFLRLSRQYGYATQDDSWGELEKELAIVFRRLERYRRFMMSQIKKELDTGNKKPIDDIEHDLLNQGEEFWNEIQRTKKFLNCIEDEIKKGKLLVELFGD